MALTITIIGWTACAVSRFGVVDVAVTVKEKSVLSFGAGFTVIAAIFHALISVTGTIELSTPSEIIAPAGNPLSDIVRFSDPSVSLKEVMIPRLTDKSSSEFTMLLTERLGTSAI